MIMWYQNFMNSATKLVLVLIVGYIIVAAPFVEKERVGVPKRDAFTYQRMR